MRHLASIRKVSEIHAIPGADNIVRLRIDGWDVVSQKGNFAEGDLCIYFEVDSFLPVTEQFEFLRKGCYRVMDGKEGFRLRTIKLRGQISQGLALPVGEFLPGVLVSEGDDVTELLGVVKWAPAIPSRLTGIAKGNFPSFIPKTDQERIQNCFNKFSHEYKDHLFEVTTKLDGASMTVYNNGDVGVCSRNLDLVQDYSNAYWKYAIGSGLASAIEEQYSIFKLSYAIQGELMGPSIQGNRENLKEYKFYVYDIWDITNQKYLDAYERHNVVAWFKDLNCNIDEVPAIEYIEIFNSPQGKDVESLLAYAEGPSINHPVREGIVLKSINDPSVSFKVISNTFLLKEKD